LKLGVGSCHSALLSIVGSRRGWGELVLSLVSFVLMLASFPWPGKKFPGGVVIRHGRVGL